MGLVDLGVLVKESQHLLAVGDGDTRRIAINIGIDEVGPRQRHDSLSVSQQNAGDPSIISQLGRTILN